MRLGNDSGVLMMLAVGMPAEVDRFEVCDWRMDVPMCCGGWPAADPGPLLLLVIMVFVSLMSLRVE